MARHSLLRRQPASVALRAAAQRCEGHRLLSSASALPPGRDNTTGTPAAAVGCPRSLRSPPPQYIMQPVWMKRQSRYSSYTTTAARSSSSSVPDYTSSVRWFSSDSDKPKSKKEKAKKEAPAAAPTEGEDKETKEETKEEEAPVAEAKEEEAAAPADESDNKETKDGDDDCPPWQNPLHHNNPDMDKQFPEDFEAGEEMPLVETPPLEDPNNPDKILASQELYDLADEIVLLSMLEMKELVNKIGDHFGFEKPPFAGSGGGGGGGDGGGDDDEDEAGEAPAAAKTAFDLKLVSFDAKSKIKVIKEVRSMANLGLKEAKEMVEGAPKTIMKDISKEAAEELAKKLEEVGAVIEIV